MANGTTITKAEAKIEDLNARREQIRLGGGQERIDKHHEQGKLTARERVDRLVDSGTFQEIGLFAQLNILG